MNTPILTAHRRRHVLRSLGTLTAHELRATLPLALTLAVAGAVLLRGFAKLSGSEPGQIGRALPFVAPSLVLVFFALVVADSFVRDRVSGLASTLAAAPLGRVRLALPRLGVLSLVGIGLWFGALALEPLTGTFYGWPLRVVATGMVAVAVFAGLAAHAFGNALAGAGVGLALAAAPLVAIGSLQAVRDPGPAAILTQASLFSFLRAMGAGLGMSMGAAALVALTVSRGARAVSVRHRSAKAALLGCAYMAPGFVSAASDAVHMADLEFDAPDASATAILREDGQGMYVHLEATRHVRSDRERPLASGREKFQFDLSQWWFVDLAGGSPVKIEAPDLESASDVRVRERVLTRDHRQRLTQFEIVSTADAAVLGTFRAYAQARTPQELDPPGTSFIYLGEDRHLYRWRASDGKSVRIGDERFDDDVRSVGCSPGGSYVYLNQSRRVMGPDSRLIRELRLVDLERGATVAAIEGIPRTWTRRAAPLLAHTWHTDEEGVTRHVLTLVGPDGTTPLPFAALEVSDVQDVDGERWLATWRGGRISLHASDGALLRTLRAPREEGRL